MTCGQTEQARASCSSPDKLTLPACKNLTAMIQTESPIKFWLPPRFPTKNPTTQLQTPVFNKHRLCRSRKNFILQRIGRFLKNFYAGARKNAVAFFSAWQKVSNARDMCRDHCSIHLPAIYYRSLHTKRRRAVDLRFERDDSLKPFGRGRSATSRPLHARCCDTGVLSATVNFRSTQS
jgi:hypothetical protein